MDKKNINLLQQRGAPPTFWEKLYDWVTNSARIIVIVVELLVLGAFGWRFFLDRKLKDINEDIEVYGEALKNLSDEEQDIRIYQTKMHTYEELWDKSSNMHPILKEVNSYIPSNTKGLSVSVSNSISGKSLKISGQISDSKKIDELEGKLKTKDDYFKDVTVDIQSSSGSDYSFSISAYIIYNEARTPLTSNGQTES